MVNLELKEGVPFDWQQLRAIRLEDWKQYATIALDHSPVYYSIRLKEAAKLQIPDEKAMAVLEVSQH